MRRTILVALVGWMFAAAPAHAAVWSRIGESVTDDVIWVDVTSIAPDQGARKAWSRTRFGHPDPSGAVESKAYYLYSCGTRQTALLSGIYYSRAGGVIRQDYVPRTYYDWHHVVPGSAGEREFNFVCTYPIGTDWRQIEGLEVEP